VPFFAYILRCADGSLYTGYTRDLDRRVAAHDAGLGASYTRGRRPVRLVHAETYDTQRDAMRRECELKRWPRARKLALIAAAALAKSADCSGGTDLGVIGMATTGRIDLAKGRQAGSRGDGSCAGDFGVPVPARRRPARR
jgi:putative endonuclease